MSYVIVDVEADGPAPGKYSMISFGAVIVEPTLSKTFYGEIKPISDNWDPEALAISGFSREHTKTFRYADIVMKEFADWLKINSVRNPIFVSDNNGFDWMFICYYFHHFYGSNPFGFSSLNLNSLYKGLTREMKGSFKHLRKTKHDHNPVNDAKGNAEALMAMADMGLKIKFE